MSRSILKLVTLMCAIVALGVVVFGSVSPARAASNGQQGLCDWFGCEGGDVRCAEGTYRWPDGHEVEFTCGGPEPDTDPS